MRRTLCLLLTLLLLPAVLCGCSGGEEPTPLLVYYPTGDGGPGLTVNAVDTRNYYGDSTVEGLTSALLGGLFGDEVELVDWSQTGDALRVTLSPGYNTLTGIDRTLADCCIVLTLCQLESVERVQVASAGAGYLAPAPPFLSADDLIFTGAEEEPRQVSVELYFPRSAGRGLGFEIRELTLTEDDDLYGAVTQALLAGPESGGLRSPFPAELTVLNTKMESGVCHVDFSAHLLETDPSPAERDLLLYSIVDTLGNLDAVSSVQLLVEGEPLVSFGSADTSLPLEPDFGLVAD